MLLDPEYYSPEARRNAKLLEESRKDRERRIKNILENRDLWLEKCRRQMVDSLREDYEWYLTAKGVAHVLSTMRTLLNIENIDTKEELELARRIAITVSAVVKGMMERAESLDFDEIDKVIDGVYSKNLTRCTFTGYELCEQYLCQEICDDIEYEINKINSSIAEAQRDLEKIAKE